MTTSDASSASRGYSSRVIARVRSADSTLIGVQLGLLCIEHNVPAAVVAERTGATRQTVYRWFFGVPPQGERLGKVEELMAQLRAQHP